MQVSIPSRKRKAQRPAIAGNLYAVQNGADDATTSAIAITVDHNHVRGDHDGNFGPVFVKAWIDLQSVAAEGWAYDAITTRHCAWIARSSFFSQLQSELSIKSSGIWVLQSSAD